MVANAVKALDLYKARIARFARSAKVAPRIESVPLPGHTPGHTGFMISDGGEQVLIWGDIVHSSFLQFAMPTGPYSADVDKDAAAATRLAMFKRAAADKLLVAGMHLPFPGFGLVVADGSAYAFAPAPWRPQL